MTEYLTNLMQFMMTGAVSEDTAGNYEAALDLYRDALGFLMAGCKSASLASTPYRTCLLASHSFHLSIYLSIYF